MTSIELQPPFRCARKDDAAAIAELMDMAAEGIMSGLWARDSAEGETALDFGAAQVARDDGDLSYRHVIVVEDEGGCLVGMIWAYVLAADDGDTPTGLMAEDVFAPLLALEATVPGTLYIDTLAIFPEFRGQGWGGRFLGLADEIACHEGATELSLIVSSPNSAKRLYERSGFVQIATRPFAPCEGFTHKSGEWQLMTCGLTQR